MESKKYNKLVNISKIRLKDIENKLAVTSGRGRVNVGGGGEEVQTIMNKTSSKMYNTRTYQYFAITVHGR